MGVKEGLASLSLAFLPPRTGTFYLAVVDANGNFGPDFQYVLRKR